MDTSQRYNGYPYGNMNGSTQDNNNDRTTADNPPSYYGHNYSQSTDYQYTSGNDTNVSSNFSFKFFCTKLKSKKIENYVLKKRVKKRYIYP